jgi:uncharacterized damage-inducible protein DinB
MNWTELLKNEIAMTYGATEGLLELVDDDALDWKPETGENWMTTGQLLFHITSACGFCCKGFVTGDWTVPGMGDLAEASDEEMLPPAEKMPSAESVAQIKEMLAADKQVALDMVDQAGEEDLHSRVVSAPWDPTERPLGTQLLMMVGHLAQHKAQLFYYLKLQGKPVNTAHLWGMA